MGSPTRIKSLMKSDPSIPVLVTALLVLTLRSVNTDEGCAWAIMDDEYHGNTAIDQWTVLYDLSVEPGTSQSIQFTEEYRSKLNFGVSLSGPDDCESLILTVAVDFGVDQIFATDDRVSLYLGNQTICFAPLAVSSSVVEPNVLRVELTDFWHYKHTYETFTVLFNRIDNHTNDFVHTSIAAQCLNPSQTERQTDVPSDGVSPDGCASNSFGQNNRWAILYDMSFTNVSVAHDERLTFTEYLNSRRRTTIALTNVDLCDYVTLSIVTDIPIRTAFGNVTVYSGSEANCTQYRSFPLDPTGTYSANINLSSATSFVSFAGPTLQLDGLRQTTFVSHCNADPCKPNPCENDGTCFEQDNAAVCECTGGYSGNKCQYYQNGVRVSVIVLIVGLFLFVLALVLLFITKKKKTLRSRMEKQQALQALHMQSIDGNWRKSYTNIETVFRARGRPAPDIATEIFNSRSGISELINNVENSSSTQSSETNRCRPKQVYRIDSGSVFFSIGRTDLHESSESSQQAQIFNSETEIAGQNNNIEQSLSVQSSESKRYLHVPVDKTDAASDMDSGSDIASGSYNMGYLTVELYKSSELSQETTVTQILKPPSEIDEQNNYIEQSISIQPSESKRYVPKAFDEIDSGSNMASCIMELYESSEPNQQITETQILNSPSEIDEQNDYIEQSLSILSYESSRCRPLPVDNIDSGSDIESGSDIVESGSDIESGSDHESGSDIVESGSDHVSGSDHESGSAIVESGSEIESVSDMVFGINELSFDS